MDIEEGGNIDDHVKFNNLSDLDVFTRQYIGTSLQREGRERIEMKPVWYLII